ncbi:Transmembrane protease, serine 13, partial [Camponotus floridanus]
NPVLANTLQCIQIPKISKRQCSEYYKYRFTITRRMLCYGFQNGQKDSCNGDSGAGLVNEDNVLLGITSWGDGCGEINSPGVYTDAIFLAPWINNIIKITKEKHMMINNTYDYKYRCVLCEIIQILKYIVVVSNICLTFLSHN